MRRSPFSPRKTRPKQLAPTRMMKARLVMRVVASITLRSMPHVNLRFTIVSTTPPTAPTDAASVGVATPAKMAPSTATMSAKAGINAMVTRLSASLRNTASSASGMAGAMSGRTRPRMAM